MGAQFTIPLVTVIPGQLIASALWNNEFQNINTNFVPAGMDSYSDTDGQMQIQTPPYPGSVTSHASNLGGEIERIRYQISAMLGATTPAFWYAKPPTDLTTVSNSIIPIGGVIDYPSATPPSANYLLANGQAIGRTAYASLFSLISTTFGIGDGSTTFNIPNYTDKMSIAAGNLYALAATGGAVNQTLAKNQIPSGLLTLNDPGHNHTQNAHNHADSGHSHIEQYPTGIIAPNITEIATSSRPGGNGSFPITFQADAANTPTQSASANIQNTTPTNNSNTTGITLTDNGGSTAVPTLPPYLGMYRLIRVL